MTNVFVPWSGRAGKGHPRPRGWQADRELLHLSNRPSLAAGLDIKAAARLARKPRRSVDGPGREAGSAMPLGAGDRSPPTVEAHNRRVAGLDGLSPATSPRPKPSLLLLENSSKPIESRSAARADV